MQSSVANSFELTCGLQLATACNRCDSRCTHKLTCPNARKRKSSAAAVAATARWGSCHSAAALASSHASKLNNFIALAINRIDHNTNHVNGIVQIGFLHPQNPLNCLPLRSSTLSAVRCPRFVFKFKQHSFSFASLYCFSVFVFIFNFFDFLTCCRCSRLGFIGFRWVSLRVGGLCL